MKKRRSRPKEAYGRAFPVSIIGSATTGPVVSPRGVRHEQEQHRRSPNPAADPGLAGCPGRPATGRRRYPAVRQGRDHLFHRRLLQCLLRQQRRRPPGRDLRSPPVAGEDGIPAELHRLQLRQEGRRAEPRWSRFLLGDHQRQRDRRHRYRHRRPSVLRHGRRRLGRGADRQGLRPVLALEHLPRRTAGRFRQPQRHPRPGGRQGRLLRQHRHRLSVPVPHLADHLPQQRPAARPAHRRGHPRPDRLQPDRQRRQRRPRRQGLPGQPATRARSATSSTWPGRRSTAGSTAATRLRRTPATASTA